MEQWGKTREDWQSFLEREGFSKHHLRGIFQKIYGKSRQIEASFLPSQLAQKLAEQALPEVDLLQSGYDGSLKGLMTWPKDKAAVEMVLMPEKTRWTLCLSTQVGCAQGCGFCATGQMGLLRQLTASQIIQQVLWAQRWLKARGQELKNVVFMGMGEPLDNVQEVVKALRILQDPWGLALAPRRITISTAGHLEGLKTLLQAIPSVSLALSLHAANEKKRALLMPIQRRYPLTKVFQEAMSWAKHHRRHLLVQYILIKGVNDTEEDLQELIALLKDQPVKVNLIPFNSIEISRFQSSDPDVVKHYQTSLLNQGIRTMVRYSKAQDIHGACGQLAREAPWG